MAKLTDQPYPSSSGNSRNLLFFKFGVPFFLMFFCFFPTPLPTPHSQPTPPSHTLYCFNIRVENPLKIEDFWENPLKIEDYVWDITFSDVFLSDVFLNFFFLMFFSDVFNWLYTEGITVNHHFFNLYKIDREIVI